GIFGNNGRRSAAADAARGAVTVDLPLAGIHNAEIALAVDDLAGQRDRAEVDHSGFRSGRAAGRVDGPGERLDHFHAVAVDERSLHPYCFRVEPADQLRRSVLARRDEQIVTQTGIRALANHPLELLVVLELER